MDKKELKRKLEDELEDADFQYRNTNKREWLWYFDGLNFAYEQLTGNIFIPADDTRPYTTATRGL